MGRFSRLLQAKGKDIVIGDETYNIKPLESKYMGLFTDSKKDQAEAMFEIVMVSLQQTHADITVDDVKELPMSVFKEVVDVIMDVNELGDE